jgi:hypothetical protein
MGLGRILSENAFLFKVDLADMSSGIFSQSSFGIVMKMGMALMPNPGGHKTM